MPRLRHHGSSAVVLLLTFAFYTECASKLTCVTNVESECEERIDGQCYCNTRWQCYKSVTVFYHDAGVDSYTEYGCLGSFVDCEKEIVIASSNTVLACCDYNNCSADLELSVNDALAVFPEPSSSQTPPSHVAPSAALHSAVTTPTITATSSEGMQHSVWSVVLWITVPVIAVVLSALLIILAVQLVCTRKRLKDMAKVRQTATNNSVIKVQYV